MVAVIKNPEKKLKMEFISHFLLPDVAVLDPRMTATLPPKTTASTGMDALCHAIEGYTCLQRNPASDGYAVSAIEIIRENLDTAVTDGKDLKARLAMAQRRLPGWGGLFQLHGRPGSRHRPCPGGRVSCAPRRRYDHPAAPLHGVQHGHHRSSLWPALPSFGRV